ncbi:protein archease [Nitrospira sp.]|nr:protein archease [Nitrospira sp.]
MTGTYRILEKIALADAAFEAVGATPSELCDTAGRALMEILANPATIGTNWTMTVDCEAETLSDLLFDWLNRLVFLKDAHSVVFHHADVVVSERPKPPSWHLHATVFGASVDPARQELCADVKAVTKHLYTVDHVGSQWCARVVLDV